MFRSILTYLCILNPTIVNKRFKSKYSISLLLYPRTIFDNLFSGFAIYFHKLLIITCQSLLNNGHEIKKCSSC